MTISLCLSDEDTMLIKNMQSLTAFLCRSSFNYCYDIFMKSRYLAKV